MRLIGSNKQVDPYVHVESIISSLSNKALDELAGGMEGDLDRIIDLTLKEVIDIIESPTRTLQKNLFDLTTFADEVEETLRSKSLSYFTTTCLPNFIMGWHNVEWMNLIQLHRFLNILAARDHCFGKGTLVRMFDGTTKPVEELIYGDELMGPDSSKRTVKKTYSGFDKMYRIHPRANMTPVDVNELHDIVTWRKGRDHYELSKPTDVQSWSIWKREKCSQKIVDFELPEKSTTIDPYFLGLWLGDGNKDSQRITTVDFEIKEYLEQYAKVREESFVYSEKSLSAKIGHPLNGKRNHQKTLRHELNQLNVLGNKHIPEDYLLNSKKKRFELLAGLIDSDGWLKDRCFRITMINENLISQIQDLARSLGFRASVNKYTNYVKQFERDFDSWCVCITGDIHKIPTKIKRKIAEKIETKRDHSRVVIDRIESLGQGQYFGFELQEDRLFLLQDGTIASNSKSYTFSFAYPLWQMYRYRPRFSTRNEEGIRRQVSPEIWRAGNGLLVTNEQTLARHLLKIIKEEIESNPILAERLLPTGKKKAGWGSDSITTKNGASLILKSAGSRARGLHCDWVVWDDFLDESSLYSAEQREKFFNLFVGVFMPIVNPGGQALVAGTPFHNEDLYHTLRKQGVFKCLEYPAVFPNGELLFPERHSIESLLIKKQTLGSLIFSREILVKPITDNTSIFPYEILKKAIKGQDNVILTPNIDSATRKFIKIAVGCDFAISGAISADYSVFTILGLDEFDHYHVLNSIRLHGAGYASQIAALKKINRDFRPEVFYAEDNGMQQIFIELLKDADLPVVGKTTNATNKKSLYQGIPSLAVLFETSRIHFPYGDKKSQNMTDLYFAELNSIAYDRDTGKLQSTSRHDDTSMSLWQGVRAIKGVLKDDFDFSFM
jgi:hypothetical protein